MDDAGDGGVGSGGLCGLVRARRAEVCVFGVVRLFGLVGVKIVFRLFVCLFWDCWMGMAPLHGAEKDGCGRTNERYTLSLFFFAAGGTFLKAWSSSAYYRVA